MRLGLISDVHANLPALETALGALGDADRVVCAGDVVGYGPWPNECVAALRDAGIPAVMGNHDLLALGLDDIERCDELAAVTMRWTRTALDDRSRAWLEALPAALDVDDVTVTHGGVGDVWRRVGDAAMAVAELERTGARVLVLGHTHHAAAWSGDGADRLAARVELGTARWVLNPGAVGQAREPEPLVRVALLDLEGGTAEFRALPYDVERCRAGLRRQGLPEEACHRRPRPWRSRAARVRDRLLAR